jgi:DNA-binding beta-propeller fold protein YncE
VTVLPVPSHGSAVLFSPDDTLAVATNRDVGSISVMRLTYPASGSPTAGLVAEVPVGGEPWQVVISPDSSTAYVVLRKDQKVVQVTNLKTTPTVGSTVATGSEPTGIALTPTGRTAWVTNFVDGTLTAIDTATMTQKSTFDLNAPLVATGFLGQVASRPALAHPRSIAITNNGDQLDTDESMYVTEYFGQATAPEAADGSNADTRKVGIVYRIKLSDHSVNTIQLAPLADMGFKDGANGTAGCYPNQLQGIATSGNFAYIVSVCASPKGPTGPKVTTTACTTAADCTGLVDPACVLPAAGAANSVCVDVASVKTTTAPVISIIDTTAGGGVGKEIAGSAVNLNAKFRDLYDTAGIPDDGTRRYPLFASDIAFVAGSSVGYVSANGADSAFRLAFDAKAGTLTSVGATTNNFIDLNPAGIATANAGLNPIGFATSSTGKKLALTVSEVSRVANLIDLNAQAIVGGPSTPTVVQLSPLPTAGSDDATRLSGKRFFNTGMARWSLKGQGWGACQSCHSDGLTDNVTWYFARGPRQSTSLDGTFNKANPDDQRVLNWTAINDELADFELNTRGISGGVGAIVSANSTPPATADRIDIATACPTVGNNPPACTNGNGNGGLNGSAAKAENPANDENLTNPGVLTNWDAITSFVKTIRSPLAPTTLDPTAVAAGAALFANDGACNGCHGDAKWTISKVTYAPSLTENFKLTTESWSGKLNGFPSSLLPATTAANQTFRFGGSNAANFDQILCALRPVGTFNVAETGAGIAELRVDMKTAAQGNGDPAANNDGKGYNPPSLFNLSTGAPYFHAGNALTLESLFSATDKTGAPVFAKHYNALAPNFLTDTDPKVVQTKINEVVAYLLSIDATTKTVPAPSLGSGGGDFCHLFTP